MNVLRKNIAFSLYNQVLVYTVVAHYWSDTQAPRGAPADEELTKTSWSWSGHFAKEARVIEVVAQARMVASPQGPRK